MNNTETSEKMDINTSVALFKRKIINSKTEEDVRVETNYFLRLLCDKHGIVLHEARIMLLLFARSLGPFGFQSLMTGKRVICS